MNKKLYFFIGTSAELIKIAPIMREFQKREINFKLITSGQNKINYEDLKDFIGPIKPYIVFAPKVDRPSIFYFLLWALKTFLTSFFLLHKEFKGLNKKNSYFIIHGDTVSSSIGALIARIYGLKLVHIESGDLSFNLFEPFPEEICRNINIRLADVLFPPNEWAKYNLNLNNVSGAIIPTKEDTIIESFFWAMKAKPINKDLQAMIKSFKKYYILIMHRQEHVIFRKGWSKKILDFVIRNANSDLNCILLKYPLTVGIIKSLELAKDGRIKMISRLPYPDFTKLMNNAEFIASDGCTNQQEAYYIGKPLLVLRDYTEQIEGIGKNVVISKGNKKIMKDFLKNYQKYKSKSIPLYVRPSKIIVDFLMKQDS